MIERVSPYLPYYPYALLVLFGLSVLLLLLAWFFVRLGRKASVWRIRHDAGRLGSRLLAAGTTLMLTVVIVAAFSAVVIVTFGYVPAFFPPRNPYNVSGVAIAHLPTPTPGATPAPALLTVSGVASVVAPDGSLLVNNQHLIPVNSPQIYVGLRYYQMPVGAAWSAVIYRDDQPVQQHRGMWAMEHTGTDCVTFIHEDGYALGDYEVRLYVKDSQTYRFAFTVSDIPVPTALPAAPAAPCQIP